MKKLISAVLATAICIASTFTLNSCIFKNRSTINGVKLSKYSIVYSEDENDYNKRAAEYIQSSIEERTALKLDVIEDDEAKRNYEIVVGETNREISKALNKTTLGVEFNIMANEDSIALEATHFVIAAAAYFFIDTYTSNEVFETTVPKEIKTHQPIVKEAKNYIFLIGDGMGVAQTLLPTVMDIPEDRNYGDNEKLFYGYLLPSFGYSRTDSLSGTTDSAAGGTALSSGYKTLNRNIGIDGNSNVVKLLTELACELGMSAAVMSTEKQTGATPASFSAHAEDRGDSSDIKASQDELVRQYGIKIDCGFDYYSKTKIEELEQRINSNLDVLDNNENGFFMMYEEAYIDKHCHNNEIDKTFAAILRFNQVIATFMEYAFYNPDTFIIITADHETGGLTDNGEGGFVYTSEDHTSADVPIFAYGYGAEIFDGKTIENVQIPKTIAKMWGVLDFGDQTSFPALED